MKVLLIDNYDSFTFNLVQRLGEVGLAAGCVVDVCVVRNDRITVDEAAGMRVTHLVISPGPCTPKETGVCSDLLAFFKGKVPILGVCLGHQTMADVHGMVVQRHTKLMHGKTSEIYHDGKGIYRGMSQPFTATRYHSLIVERDSVGSGFEISAWTAEDEVMGLRWTGGAGDQPMEGVQFHPESFLTVEGPRLLANFLGLESGAGKGAVTAA